MGCITSKGKEWPPKPYKRFIVRTRSVTDKSGLFTEIQAVEDYVWVYPGVDPVNGCGGVVANWCEEISPGQEIAIRCLEDG